MGDGLTAEVSQFVSGTPLDAVPPEVIRAAKHSILDGFGLAVAGARTEGVAIVAAEVASYDCRAGTSTVLGRGAKLPPRFAAFLNGMAIHADDYDDTQLAVLPDRVYGLLTHPTAPVLPAVLALAERDGASGADLLAAYLIGVEVESAIAESINPRHYEAGFHSTGTAGTFGAAAGAARLLGYHTMTSIIRVRMNDGREFTARATFGKGSPANPMSEAELLEKFAGCLKAGGIDTGAGRRAADLILGLESQPDMRAIVGLLSGDG